MKLRFALISVLTFICPCGSFAQPLPGTQPLTIQGDLAAEMVGGIDRYLARETAASVADRARVWKRDLSSPEAYERSIAPNRERLRQILGVVDTRTPPAMHVDSWVTQKRRADSLVADEPRYKVYAVRWPVLRGVEGEGLLLVPKGRNFADIIALPDCDWTPEQLVGLAPGVPDISQFARRLAESGCRVLVPVLIDRKDTYSGAPEVQFTNQPHREFLWRAAYEMGRTPIGYEVQKVLAAVDWLDPQRQEEGRSAPNPGANRHPNADPTRQPREFSGVGPWDRQPLNHRPIGVVGYGEGGLIAFYAAACDTRIDACCVSGYFGPREGLVDEPLYRNVFGLLREFGDAEIASLIAPRPLIVEASAQPKIDGPPSPRQGRSGAAPGRITTPTWEAVKAEAQRARELTRGTRSQLTAYDPTQVEEKGPGSKYALDLYLKALGTDRELDEIGRMPRDRRTGFVPEARLKRQFSQILEDTQVLMRESPFVRAEFWKRADASSPEKWRESTRSYRDYFWDEVIGRLPAPAMPMNPRTRLIYDTPKTRGYEVVLDTYPDVFAYGILHVPKDLKPGEKRPVVVCQHGLEGRPQHVADPAVDNPAYHTFAYRLAERGFITYSPQNPYIGETRFRQVLHRAQPLHLTLFSFIVRQHERTLEWLASQPFVDPERMAFYGLSYGGKTAMRVPATLERYCLSICSADYNEWIWKCVSARSPYSYLFTVEYDMPEWNLGNTFNYAEMSWLVCPRPFMVERGHQDGVAPDEWVAYEYAKTRRRFDLLGLGDRTELEVFNGPHTIHGIGTFDFLHKHLHWPKPP